jgi:hypothetical protein
MELSTTDLDKQEYGCEKRGDKPMHSISVAPVNGNASSFQILLFSGW